MPPQQILIIQTAFIGDVILASALIEKLHFQFPNAQIDFLLRKGNEALFENHPKLREVHIWDKKEGKYRNLFRLIKKIRSKRYDVVVNAQRFANSGILTALSGGSMTIGFDKNPFSWAFKKKITHWIQEGTHEVERNHELIKDFTDTEPGKPVLYPSESDYESVRKYQQSPYLCMAPASVWFTKQFPKEKWVELVKEIPFTDKIYLIGAPSDRELCEDIIEKSGKDHLVNLCGQLSLLQSAALMKKAVLNYVNDSAPMHLASAVDANTCAIYCSTVPQFGFGPLATFSEIAEVNDLDCRPCGLHGFKECPKGHFKCGYDMDISKLIQNLNKVYERT